MNKCLLLALIVLGLTSCAAKDEQYYRTHPKELQQLIKECPEKQPKNLTCQKLEQIAVRLNHLAYELQYNPQGFGGQILQLQQTISNQQTDFLKNDKDSELKTKIAKNKAELAEHLVIVKWLMSPES